MNEEARKNEAKATRMMIRLTHTLAAGEEIHAVLPDTLEGFKEQLARGELKLIKASLDEIIEA